EEWKMVAETKKMLDPKIKLTATCVRVPVFIGHSEAVNIEFEKPITADEAREILREAPEHRMAAATRKALMLRIARAGAARLLAAELAGVSVPALDGESE
ncbi:DNA repair protein MmcB-related protein, partial [bacterium M00.F.Ca.ET.228.01.1.1]